MPIFLTSDHKDEKKEKEKKHTHTDELWLVTVSDMPATALFEVFADL